MRIEAVVVPGLSLVACSGAAEGGDVDVLPFEEVQASEFVFELDPTDPSRCSPSTWRPRLVATRVQSRSASWLVHASLQGADAKR